MFPRTDGLPDGPSAPVQPRDLWVSLEDLAGTCTVPDGFSKSESNRVTGHHGAAPPPIKSGACTAAH